MFSPHSQMELSGEVRPAALTTAAAEPAAELLAGSEPAVEPPGHLQRFMVRDPSTGKLSVKEPSTVEEAIALALGPAFTPSPRAVTARDAFTPRMASELEEQSFTSWCAGGAIPYAPTTALWRRECKESLILASTPRSMQERREAESARPDATEPADMAEYWHMAGWDAMAPAFFKPILARQLLPGQLPAANICALYAAHVATGECESCNARKPCYTGAVCNLLQDVTWPWKGGTPPPPATAVPPPQPYDKRRTEQTLKLLERGTYIEITDPTVVRAWGQVLNAPRRNPVLTEQEVACISADGSAPAAVAASARAQTFVSTLKAALLRGRSTHEAWEVAAEAAFPEAADRQVIDLSGWKEDCISLKMRYAKLQPILEFISPGVRLGTTDLKSGYSQLCLNMEAALYTGLALQMEPGGPARYFIHGRLPPAPAQGRRGCCCSHPGHAHSTPDPEPWTSEVSMKE